MHLIRASLVLSVKCEKRAEQRRATAPATTPQAWPLLNVTEQGELIQPMTHAKRDRMRCDTSPCVSVWSQAVGLLCGAMLVHFSRCAPLTENSIHLHNI